MIRGADLAAAAAVYRERRIVLITLLGFASGLPLALTGSTLTLWMADRGVSITTIGLFSLIGLPYVLKFLWAPLLDALHPPMPLRRLGQRRGWIVAVQILLIVAIAVMGLLDPVRAVWPLAVAALAVAALSATQDIAIDAFRVEFLPEDRQAAGMAGFVAAYRVALIVGGVVPVLVAAALEARGLSAGFAWAGAYGVAAAGLVFGLGAALAAGPQADAARLAAMPVRPSLAERLRDAVRRPLASFMRHRAWLWLLVFVALFKLGDALAATLIGPFALDLGFDKTTVAGVIKGVGLAAVLAGGFVGGLLGRTLSVCSALWVAGIAQMVSNLAFTALALIGPSTAALSAAIAIESFCGGIGTVIFVAFLSALCNDRAATAAQYALLSALAALGRTLFSAAAGYIAAAAGWPVFFAITAAAAIPGLILLAVLARNGALAPFARSCDRARPDCAAAA